jgi:hypothetical protein
LLKKGQEVTIGHIIIAIGDIILLVNTAEPRAIGGDANTDKIIVIAPLI